MIFGKTLMWVAFFASLLALLGFFMTLRGRRGWLVPARIGHVVMTVALMGSVAWLMNLILTHQFQFTYVYRYSSRDLPLHFLISTFWAGQEGTFLLWAMYTAILGIFVIRTGRQFEAGVMTFVLLLQNFLIVILLKLSPFAVYPATPPDGAGLNPLLQDYWMVIHPPLLFVGFAAFTVPAAFAMHAMVRKDTDEWVKGALPWTVFAVLVLGTAICLGGYWAYRTLGWGGYWGWDPVENSSFVPWLFGVALLHGLVVQQHKGSMKRLNLFLAVLAFMLILYSTFLTRSGVLGDFSVHSFVDLGINGFLVAFVVSYALLGFGLYFWRVRGMKESSLSGSLLSREYGMFLGALSVMLFSTLVLIGTSAPLLTRITGPASNVSMGYYKAISIPFGILFTSFLAVVPNLAWGRKRKGSILKALIAPAVLGALTTVLLILLGVKDVAYVALCFTASTALFTNLEIVFDTIRRNVARAGGYIVHVGVGLMLIGIVTSTIYDKTESIVLPKGEVAEAFGYHMVWHGARPIDNGTKFAYDIHVMEPSGKTFVASPVMFFSAYNNGVMRRPAIKRFARHDLYLSPQGVDRDEAIDRMARHDLTLALGQSASVGETIVTFERFEPLGMTPDRIELAAVLSVKNGDRLETVKPVIIATGEGQEYQEAVAGDGTKILVRRADPQGGRAQIYVRQPGSPHYDMPTEALYVNVELKPYIMILWIGTFLGIGGLILAVVYRARAAAISGRKKRGVEVHALPEEPPAAAVEAPAAGAVASSGVDIPGGAPA